MFTLIQLIFEAATEKLLTTERNWVIGCVGFYVTTLVIAITKEASRRAGATAGLLSYHELVNRKILATTTMNTSSANLFTQMSTLWYNTEHMD